MKKWLKIDKPACDCTHTLSMLFLTLASSRKPKNVLPGVSCPCTRTWMRWKDKQLFAVPEGEDHR